MFGAVESIRQTHLVLVLCHIIESKQKNVFRCHRLLEHYKSTRELVYVYYGGV